MRTRYASLGVMSERGDSAPQSIALVDRSFVFLEDAEDDPPMVQSELLTYVVYCNHIHSTDMIKNTVLDFYTDEAKTVIWHAHENCLPPERRRVTTDKRSANEANLSDIIGAVSELDAKGKLLSGSLCATKLDRLPKYAPE